MTQTMTLVLLSVIAPLTSLWLAAPSIRSSQGLAVNPFGWPSLLVIHVFSAIPLSIYLAQMIRSRFPQPKFTTLIFIGLVGCGIAHYGIDSLGKEMENAGFGFVIRGLIRSLLAIVLSFPFLLAAPLAQFMPRSWVSLFVGLLIALALPMIWADKLTKETTPLVTAEIAKGRLVRAGRHLEGLNDIAPDRSFLKGVESRTFIELRRSLYSDIRKASERVAQIPKDSAKWQEKIDYAKDLILLDRLAEAEQILSQLPTNPVAQRYLSEVYQLQKRYVESDAVLRSFLSEGLRRTDKPQVRMACVEAFDQLANNAAEQGNYNQVETILKEAIENLPNDEAYFRYELGLHYQMRNRPFDAIREFNQAVRLDASLESRVAPLLRNLKEHTPACFVGR